MKKYSKTSAKLRAIIGDVKNDIIVDGVGSLSSRLSRAKDKITEYHYSDGNWYRLYESGWCEQGGTFTATSSTTIITLPIEMSDINYFASGNYQNSADNFYSQCYDFTTTTVTMKTYSDKTINWQVKGFKAN